MKNVWSTHMTQPYQDTALEQQNGQTRLGIVLHIKSNQNKETNNHIMDTGTQLKKTEDYVNKKMKQQKQEN